MKKKPLNEILMQQVESCLQPSPLQQCLRVHQSIVRSHVSEVPYKKSQRNFQLVLVIQNTVHWNSAHKIKHKPVQSMIMFIQVG
jgi:hypothetical protein